MSLDDSITLLQRFPGVLSVLLSGLPGTAADGGWSLTKVAAHLVHGEQTNWIPRIRWLLEFGEAKPFPVFDRTPPSQLVALGLEALLMKFAEERKSSLHQFQALGLTDADCGRKSRHPVLETVTLGELIATWASHDLTHLHQVTRILAHNNREAVGPFAKYLGVMRCQAHGE